MGLKALWDNCRYFAGNQVRNVACLAGNICTASPISDLNPVFMTLNAVLYFESNVGKREMPIRDFFIGYRKTGIRPTEVLTGIRIPFGTVDQFSAAFKQAKRRDDDIAIVNAAFSVTLKSHNNILTVVDACFSYGGLGPTTSMAQKTMSFIAGKEWNLETMERCYPLILEDFSLSATAPGGQIEYRKTLGIIHLI